MDRDFDIVGIGGGHAGAEAALVELSEASEKPEFVTAMLPTDMRD